MLFANLQYWVLGDIGEVFGAIAALIGLILWIIQKVVETNKARQPQLKPQQPRAKVEQADPLAGAQGAGQQADPLRSQVEEFLRRANQGEQPDRPVRRPAQAQRDIEVLVDDASTETQRRPVGAPFVPLESSFSSKKSVTSPEQRPARRPVAPRKRKSLAERSSERAVSRAESIGKQASRLGQRIIAEDLQFDEQLKAKFDHSVGTLSGISVSSAELVPVVEDTPASRIAAMLASPDGVRQAIIMNEVLQRPVDRW